MKKARIEPADAAEGVQEVDVSGPRGETLFDRLVNWAILRPETVDLASRTIVEIERAAQHQDDRLVALMGAMLVEQRVDALLRAFVPGASDLEARQEITFAVRIAILRALRVVPTKVLKAADTVRGIRNIFAHNKDARLIDDLSSLVGEEKRAAKLLQQLEQDLRGFLHETQVSRRSPRQVFLEVVSLTVMALAMYEPQLRTARQFIDSMAFRQALKDFAEADRQS